MSSNSSIRNTITLRSGKELKASEIEKSISDGQEEEKDEEVETSKTPKIPDSSPTKDEVKPYIPPIPYPERLVKRNLDKQFEKFLELFKKLQINIPLLEALKQCPSYGKFLKDILANKQKLEDGETVNFNEECSAILQNKLSPKLKDSGSFTIPCHIGNERFEKALCDLRVIINLMHYSVFEKLGIGEVKDTIVSLQLADRSIKYLRGIVENVLVKVDKFIFPAVSEGKLVLRLGEDKVIFNFLNAMKYPSKLRECQKIDMIDREIKTIFHLKASEDPLLMG